MGHADSDRQLITTKISGNGNDGKFLPGLSDTCKPLQDLLQAGNAWNWDADQETAVEKIRKAIISTPKFFDPKVQKQYNVMLLEQVLVQFFYSKSNPLHMQAGL